MYKSCDRKKYVRKYKGILPQSPPNADQTLHTPFVSAAVALLDAATTGRLAPTLCMYALARFANSRVNSCARIIRAFGRSIARFLVCLFVTVRRVFRQYIIGNPPNLQLWIPRDIFTAPAWFSHKLRRYTVHTRNLIVNDDL